MLASKETGVGKFVLIFKIVLGVIKCWIYFFGPPDHFFFCFSSNVVLFAFQFFQKKKLLRGRVARGIMYDSMGQRPNEYLPIFTSFSLVRIF